MKNFIPKSIHNNCYDYRLKLIKSFFLTAVEWKPDTIRKHSYANWISRKAPKTYQLSHKYPSTQINPCTPILKRKTKFYCMTKKNIFKSQDFQHRRRFPTRIQFTYTSKKRIESSSLERNSRGSV